MQARLLDQDEFEATMSPKMHDGTETDTAVLDIWPYVDSVPSADLEGHPIYDRFVEVVYLISPSSPQGRRYSMGRRGVSQ